MLPAAERYARGNCQRRWEFARIGRIRMVRPQPGRLGTSRYRRCTCDGCECWCGCTVDLAGRTDDSRVTVCGGTVAFTAGVRSSSLEPVAQGAHANCSHIPRTRDPCPTRVSLVGGVRLQSYSERHRSPSVVLVPVRFATTVAPVTGTGRSAAVSPPVGPSQLKSLESWLVTSPRVTCLPGLSPTARPTAGPLPSAAAQHRSPVRHARTTTPLAGASIGHGSDRAGTAPAHRGTPRRGALKLGMPRWGTPTPGARRQSPQCPVTPRTDTTYPSTRVPTDRRTERRTP